MYSEYAQFKFYYNTEKGHPPLVEEYHIKSEEFLTFAVGDRPAGAMPVRTFGYDFPQITKAQFLSIYGGGVWNSVKRFFSF